MGELMIGMSRNFAFYNGERLLQTLRNKTPDVVYRTGKGGGLFMSKNIIRQT